MRSQDNIQQFTFGITKKVDFQARIFYVDDLNRPNRAGQEGPASHPGFAEPDAMKS